MHVLGSRDVYQDRSLLGEAVAEITIFYGKRLSGEAVERIALVKCFVGTSVVGKYIVGLKVAFFSSMFLLPLWQLVTCMHMGYRPVDKLYGIDLKVLPILFCSC